MTPARLPFFVYGTLRPGGFYHDAFLAGRFLRTEPARLPGAALYEGPGYPYAVEDPRPAGAVVGDLVVPRPDAYDDLVRRLDHLEEYRPGDPANVYERVPRTVLPLDGGTPVRAWVYVAADALAEELRAHGRRLPHGDWFSHAPAVTAPPPLPAPPPAPPPVPDAPRTS